MKLTFQNAGMRRMLLLIFILYCIVSKADTGGRNKPSSSDIGIQSLKLVGQDGGCSLMRVRVQVKNFDATASVPAGTNLVASYDVDGVGVASEVITLQQDLAPLGSVSHIFGQTVDFAGHSILHAAVNSLGADVDPTNNGMMIPVHTNGIYTIGGVAPDFPKIQQAIDFVSQQDEMGYCTNAIIFNIRPGVYQGPVMVNDIAVLGSSLRLILQSETGNSADVVVTSNTTSTFLLKNTRHVTFNNLSVTYEGQSLDDAAILMAETCQDIRIENCTVARSPNVMGYTVRLHASGLTLPQTPGSRVLGFHAINSKFYNGGISLYDFIVTSPPLENTDVNIIGNTFIDFNHYGVEVHYVDHIYIADNEMQSANFSDGVSVWFVSKKATVERNRIRLGSGRMGVTVGAQDQPHISVVNNFINVKCGTAGEVVGLLVVGCEGEVLHNSVRIGRGAVHPLQNKAIVFYNVDGALQVKNNIFYSIVSGAVGVRISKAQESDQNYNNIYIPYGKTGHDALASVFYPDLISWKGATGFDGSSIAAFVAFNGDEDLHLSDAQPDLIAGTPTNVLHDIDKQPRSAPPYLGADEFDDGSVATLPDPKARTEGEPTTLFPNPVTGDYFEVDMAWEKSDAGTVVIVNQYGERQTETIPLTKGSTHRISVAGLAPGLYLLQVTDGSGTRRTIRFEKK